MRVIYMMVYISLLIFSAQVQSADDLPKHIHVSMQQTGYTMGDLMPMHIEMTLPDDHTIDADSLPLIGRVRPWLDIRALNYQQQGNQLHIDIVWQIFATVEIAQMLKTPEIVIKTIAPKPQRLTIPAQGFYYSPSFPYPLPEIKRMENLPPLLASTSYPFTLAVSSLLMACICLLAWAWFNDKISFLPFKPGPLTQLHRSWKKQALQQLMPDHIKQLHHALNISAGQTLYPSNLHVLFERAPYLLLEQSAIADFFNYSWTCFYGQQRFDTAQLANLPIDSQSTLDWLAGAAMAERLFRRTHHHLNTVYQA